MSVFAEHILTITAIVVGNFVYIDGGELTQSINNNVTTTTSMEDDER